MLQLHSKGINLEYSLCATWQPWSLASNDVTHSNKMKLISGQLNASKHNILTILKT